MSQQETVYLNCNMMISSLGHCGNLALGQRSGGDLGHQTYPRDCRHCAIQPFVQMSGHGLLDGLHPCEVSGRFQIRILGLFVLFASLFFFSWQISYLGRKEVFPKPAVSML